MHSLLKSLNLEKLELHMNGFVIRVPIFLCFPSLTVLKLTGITLSCDPSNHLPKLNLILPVLRTYEAENCTWLNVEGVTFEVPLLEILNLVIDSSSVNDSLNFEMLSYLELGNVTGKVLLMLLVYTPFLKTLILKVLIQLEEYLLDPELVPPYFESNLQVVHFGRLNGDEHEMRFVKYVLENAQALETANYSVTRELYQRSQKHMDLGLGFGVNAKDMHESNLGGVNCAQLSRQCSTKDTLEIGCQTEPKMLNEGRNLQLQGQCLAQNSLYPIMFSFASYAQFNFLKSITSVMTKLLPRAVSSASSPVPTKMQMTRPESRSEEVGVMKENEGDDGNRQGDDEESKNGDEGENEKEKPSQELGDEDHNH
ncbi:hypothetical protein Fmac_018843 [Flemingia macrophylla]|uniref:FBD domain-containing protein n=1 Tax=Flemingia macrophylla TaxID=520843 RepID=A0ABD1M6J4_9FABA